VGGVGAIIGSFMKLVEHLFTFRILNPDRHLHLHIELPSEAKFSTSSSPREGTQRNHGVLPSSVRNLVG
jgi:hypothetical protein